MKSERKKEAFEFIGCGVAMALAIALSVAPWFVVTDTVEASEMPHGLNMSRLGLSTKKVELPDVTPAIVMKANKTIAKAKIDSAFRVMDLIDSLEPETVQLVYVGEFYITMYAATVEQCGNSLGITASGRKVTDNPECHTVAVDPSVIPLGSNLKIEGWPDVYRADDTGSAIQGFDIDVFTTSEAESKQFNNQSGVKVWIIKD